ncbi:MAG: SOS response-associated peptidase [Rhodospirillaceae bacterium]|nr:SOS response-associated peptidase [Rhodospirillaceae bacterium]MBL6942211.1 SOS response-associated peptidase [Rhodospirillales bacterium]
MCSRYEIDAPWSDIAQRFGLDDAADGFAGGEIRPTDMALVITSGGSPCTMRWGIPASWDGKPLINARCETLKQKQSFRPLLTDRCLVPASAYFEWRRDGKKRLKNTITFNNYRLMAFAGLRTADHFTIITCQPNPSIAHIHNRMPVTLPTMAESQWSDNTLPFEDVRHLLKPHDTNILMATEAPEPPTRQPDLFA